VTRWKIGGPSTTSGPLSINTPFDIIQDFAQDKFLWFVAFLVLIFAVFGLFCGVKNARTRERRTSAKLRIYVFSINI
jgi:hypothetical protein